MLSIPTTTPLLLVLSAIGTLYAYGAGTLKGAPSYGPDGAPDPKGRKGWDCSGFVQWALYVLGLLRPDAWHDMTAHDIANACNPVRDRKPRLGDLVFYGRNGRITHVMLCLNETMVIGATGGDSRTHADNPKACVQVLPIRYRYDVVVIAELKPQYRVAA